MIDLPCGVSEDRRNLQVLAETTLHSLMLHSAIPYFPVMCCAFTGVLKAICSSLFASLQQAPAILPDAIIHTSRSFNHVSRARQTISGSVQHLSCAALSRPVPAPKLVDVLPRHIKSSSRHLRQSSKIIAVHCQMPGSLSLFQQSVFVNVLCLHLIL